jgi:hypothetical protein
MKYALIVLICIVCAIGGIIIGFEFSSSQFFSSLKAPASSVQGSVAADTSKALACSDIFSVGQLKTFSGIIKSIGTSTISVAVASGKPVTVAVTPKTVIENEIPKSASAYQKDLAAFTLAQKNRPANATTSLPIAPPPFTISLLSLRQLVVGEAVTVLSNDQVIGKEAVAAATLSVASNASSSTAR